MKKYLIILLTTICSSVYFGVEYFSSLSFDEWGMSTDKNACFGFIVSIFILIISLLGVLEERKKKIN